MNVYDKLTELDITLPPVAIPAAAYVPFVQTGNLVFLSGHIAKKDGKPWVGQLGKNIDTAEGKAAARAIAIDLMGTLHAAVGAVEPACSGGNTCTVRHCPRRQCGQHETSMSMVRCRNCAASSQAWGWSAGMPSAARAWAIRSCLSAGLSSP